ncbi:hypothetical protein FJY90_05120 [Candidatus Gottesmanbacteria bacterium]|nr:hypothetical protein [Candidatus Gottesmanbacteria bacterium]
MMISSGEIEILAHKIFKKNVLSIRQVNRTTIRIGLIKDIFIDVFQSLKDPTKFAFHAKIEAKKIFRADCQPERKYQKLKTFPWHFHKGKEDKVITSPFSRRKRTALIQFFNYIYREIKTSF